MYIKTLLIVIGFVKALFLVLSAVFLWNVYIGEETFMPGSEAFTAIAALIVTLFYTLFAAELRRQTAEIEDITFVQCILIVHGYVAFWFLSLTDAPAFLITNFLVMIDVGLLLSEALPFVGETMDKFRARAS